MELSFIVAAIRRRLWLVLLLTVIGGVAASLIDSSSKSDEYQARAVLLIQPPTSTGGTVINSDPDRYVIGQLRFLESADLAERVAAQVPGETRATVQNAVRVEHQPKTDIVDVLARATDPARAQVIANTYVQLYMSDLRSRVDTAQAPGITELTTRLETLRKSLVDIQKRIDSTRPDPAKPNVTVPSDPEAEADQQLLLAEYNQVLASKTELQAGGYAKVTSEIVEEATMPTATLSSGGKLIIIAGILGGLSLGVVGAILAARISPMILDRYEVETALNLPVAGELIYTPALARSRTAALRQLPSSIEQVVGRLCARAEANASDDRPLVIAVIGTQRRAGTSTLTLAMAGRFARTDTSAVVVDFDTQDPEITRLFAAGSAGIPALLSYLNQPQSNGAMLTSHQRARKVDPTSIFSSTPNNRVRVLGIGADPDTLTLRRTELSRVLEYASHDVGVVIADAGALPDTAAAEQLVRLADCVVLAVPVRRLRAATLEAVERLLSGRVELLLPVITHPGRSRWAFRRRTPSQPSAAATEPVAELEDDLDDLADEPARS
ncbi:MAG TPA: hypothetical protein VGQ20_16560 [Acidimicrobiales bacterium]|nr:hypothetical protein [Acidimicrobiales bacterium]